MSPAERLAGFAAIPLKEIEPSPNNVRAHLEELPSLALSIKETGLIQPLVVQRLEDRTPPLPLYRIVAGHRRFAAIKLLHWESVPCIVRKPMLDDAELLAMLVENGQRADLDPIEEARAINRLKTKLGLTEAEVARRIGRSQDHVANRIMLLSLPIDQQEEVRANVMTLTEARDRARIESGRIRPKATGRAPGGLHLSARHELSTKARNRCISLGHSRGAGKGVGGIACGECWESVIRADERTRIHAASTTAGRCLICNTEQTFTALDEGEATA